MWPERGPLRGGAVSPPEGRTWGAFGRGEAGAPTETGADRMVEADAGASAGVGIAAEAGGVTTTTTGGAATTGVVAAAGAVTGVGGAWGRATGGSGLGRSGAVVAAMGGDSGVFGRGEGGTGAGIGFGRTGASGAAAEGPDGAEAGEAGADFDSPRIRSTIPSSKLARVLFLTSSPHVWIRSRRSWLLSPNSFAN